AAQPQKQEPSYSADIADEADDLPF
ncbi:MAG: hypothetical protein RL226_902, partial [Bacteroidota bacterium]